MWLPLHTEVRYLHSGVLFINYCNYRVFHREFLWLVCVNKYQMGLSFNILHPRYQEWLKYQTFTAFLHKFHISINFGNFIGFHCWLFMTWVMPSQCHITSLVLMPVVQFICFSPVEAYFPSKCCLFAVCFMVLLCTVTWCPHILFIAGKTVQ